MDGGRERGANNLCGAETGEGRSHGGEAGLGFDNEEHQVGFKLFIIILDLNHEGGFLVITIV